MTHNQRSYQVWATVKRRLCRMLLFTISLRKRRGELLGDSLGDVAFLFPPTTPGILGGSSSRCMCSLNVRMQESISTLSSLDDIPAGWVESGMADFPSSFKFFPFLSKFSHIRWSHTADFVLLLPYPDTEFTLGWDWSNLTHKHSHSKRPAHTYLFCCLCCFCTFYPSPFSLFFTGLGISQPAVVPSPTLCPLAHARRFRGALPTAGSHTAPPRREFLFSTLLLSHLPPGRFRLSSEHPDARSLTLFSSVSLCLSVTAECHLSTNSFS